MGKNKKYAPAKVSERVFERFTALRARERTRVSQLAAETRNDAASSSTGMSDTCPRHILNIPTRRYPPQAFENDADTFEDDGLPGVVTPNRRLKERTDSEVDPNSTVLAVLSQRKLRVDSNRNHLTPELSPQGPTWHRSLSERR